MSRATPLLSLVILGLGVAMIATTVTRGGGPTAQGIVIGVLFVAAGCGRIWLGRRTR